MVVVRGKDVLQHNGMSICDLVMKLRERTRQWLLANDPSKTKLMKTYRDVLAESDAEVKALKAVPTPEKNKDKLAVTTPCASAAEDDSSCCSGSSGSQVASHFHSHPNNDNRQYQ